MRSTVALLLLGLSTAAVPVRAQGVRNLTRPAKGTIVSEAQAADLTLTVSQVAVRPIQSWVRTAGALDKTGKILTAYLSRPDADSVKVGQRVRTFTPNTKSSMFQGYVTRVLPQGPRTQVEVTLAATGWKANPNYVMEIVTERGDFLSVANEAIIEEGDQHFVYVQQGPGNYVPQQVEIGVQGELYTQILNGLKDGDQVVTFGSFFIDSEYKLKGSGNAPANDQHH